MEPPSPWQDDPAISRDWDETLGTLGTPVRDGARADCEAFLDALLRINRVHNLTAMREPAQAWRGLVCQSLAFLPALRRHLGSSSTLALVDVGAGGGVPGLPVFLAWNPPPTASLTSIEARLKKARAIEEMAAGLELPGVEVRCQRAEEVGQDPAARERFDAALCRAVGSIAEVLEYCLPLVRPGGVALIAKSFEQVDAELPSGRVASRLLGGDPPEVELITLLGQRTALICVAKARQTPRSYPRRPGIPRQSPLG